VPLLRRAHEHRRCAEHACNEHRISSLNYLMSTHERNERTDGNVESVRSFVCGFGSIDEDVDQRIEIKPSVERTAAELAQKRRCEEHPSVERDTIPVQEEVLFPLLFCGQFQNRFHCLVVHERSHYEVLFECRSSPCASTLAWPPRFLAAGHGRADQPCGWAERRAARAKKTETLLN
jgi:hypothetical protein